MNNFFNKKRKYVGPADKEKEDKTLNLILIGLAIMLIYGIITGIEGDTLRAQIDNGIIRMSFSDIIILCSLGAAYAFSGKKKK